jgi:hypothetical protein
MEGKEIEAQIELGALHLAEAEILLGKEEALIAHMESLGVDTTVARQVLELQRALHRQHHADWDMLKSELAHP